VVIPKRCQLIEAIKKKYSKKPLLITYGVMNVYYYKSYFTNPNQQCVSNNVFIKIEEKITSFFRYLVQEYILNNILRNYFKYCFI